MLVAMYGGAAHGQSVDQWIAWGDAATARGEHYGASRFYAGALELEPGRMALQWKQAEAYRLSDQYPQAAALYERVAQKDMGRTYPTAFRWLAEMQMCQGNYSEATSSWRKVLQKEKDKQSFTAKRAENGIAGCTMALAPPKEVEFGMVEHLLQPVNTYDSEFGARIGPDSLLYFASLRGDLNKEGEVLDTASYNTGLLRAARGATAWNTPEVLSSINTNGDNANATWTTDGKWILFTRCVEGSPCRIHIAPITDHGYGEAQPLPGMGDTLLSTQPMVVRWLDREMLFFVSDRNGGQGGTDIWQAELINGEAKHLYPIDSPVNTLGNERCPWYDNTSNALWYSSDFLPGFGGYDIFSAAFDGDIFANPVNVGLAINSAANDLYPMYDPVRGEGWLTSNRIGSFAAKGETCCNDLYRFNKAKTIVAQPVVLVPKSTFMPTGSAPERALLKWQADFPLKLYFHNDEPEPRSWATTTGQTYATTFTKYQALFPTYRNENADPTPINSFFNEDVERGREKLDALVQALIPVLEEGQRVTLDVRGHASPLAKNDYNRNLSLRRIESLRQHLLQVENGRLRAYLDSTASNGGVLRINVLPFGEDRSASGVSDDLGDLKHSVYSVEAARERRIEVERVAVEPSTTNVAGDRSFDMGTVHQSEQRAFNITFKNTGTSTLRILRGRTSCDCIQVQHLPDTVAPQGSAVIQLLYTGRARPGPLERTIILDTDGTPSQIELTIHGTVIE